MKIPNLDYKKVLKVLFLLLTISYSLLSCNTNGGIYEQYQVIEGTEWNKDKEYYFTFSVEDISPEYDISLQIRNNNKYPYQNLWVFIQEEPPIGKLKRDTVECILADNFGKWNGHGISLFESGFKIRKGIRFPHKGQYTFAIKQAMRDSIINGIQEIGLLVTVNAPSLKHRGE